MAIIGIIFIVILGLFIGGPGYMVYEINGFEGLIYYILIMGGIILVCWAINKSFDDPEVKTKKRRKPSKKRKYNPNLNAFQQPLDRDK